MIKTKFVLLIIWKRKICVYFEYLFFNLIYIWSRFSTFSQPAASHQHSRLGLIRKFCACARHASTMCRIVGRCCCCRCSRCSRATSAGVRAHCTRTTHVRRGTARRRRVHALGAWPANRCTRSVAFAGSREQQSAAAAAAAFCIVDIWGAKLVGGNGWKTAIRDCWRARAVGEWLSAIILSEPSQPQPHITMRYNAPVRSCSPFDWPTKFFNFEQNTAVLISSQHTRARSRAAKMRANYIWKYCCVRKWRRCVRRNVTK